MLQQISQYQSELRAEETVEQREQQMSLCQSEQHAQETVKQREVRL